MGSAIRNEGPVDSIEVLKYAVLHNLGSLLYVFHQPEYRAATSSKATIMSFAGQR